MTADLGGRLVAHLRGALREPGLDLAEGPTELPGGFDTRIYAFRLRGGPPDLAHSLVLRLLGLHHDPRRALREQAVQNAVAAQGFPAPRAPLASADVTPLGSAFVIMERVPGRPLMTARAAAGIGRILADTQARLRALDPAPVLAAIAAAGLAPEAATFAGYLAEFAARVSRGGLEGLGPAMAWLLDHAPAGPGATPGSPPAICHGDFHPQNVLVDGGTVTGVLDWPNAIVADPAFDVASTRLILTHFPLGLIGMPRWRRWLVAAAQRRLLGVYLARSTGHLALDPRRRAYLEAAACMRGLVSAAEARLRRRDAPMGPLAASDFPERLAAHFHRVSGVRPVLPPAPVIGSGAP